MLPLPLSMVEQLTPEACSARHPLPCYDLTVILHSPAALPTTRLSTKGQVILPKSVREAEALEPGAEFTVEKVPEGILLRPLKTAPSRIEDVSGCLRYRGKPKSVAEMNRAIAMEIRERHGRGRY